MERHGASQNKTTETHHASTQSLNDDCSTAMSHSSIPIAKYYFCEMSSSRSVPSTRNQDHPIYCRCNLQCTIYTCNKANNRGRKFYRCPRSRDENDCGFFRWFDEHSEVLEDMNHSRCLVAAEVRSNDAAASLTFEFLQIKFLLIILILLVVVALSMTCMCK